MQGTPYCYRFRVPPNENILIPDRIRGDVRFNTNALGDFVILRSNGLPVYNFCVAVDDALMRITHVIRAVRDPPDFYIFVKPTASSLAVPQNRAENPALLTCRDGMVVTPADESFICLCAGGTSSKHPQTGEEALDSMDSYCLWQRKSMMAIDTDMHIVCRCSFTRRSVSAFPHLVTCHSYWRRTSPSCPRGMVPHQWGSSRSRGSCRRPWSTT